MCLMLGGEAVSYRAVLVFSLLLLRLGCDRRRLGLVPGNLQHATFKLGSLVGGLERKKKKKDDMVFIFTDSSPVII